MKVKLTMLLLALAIGATSQEKAIQFKGELQQWHKLELTVEGPETSEYARENPFLDYNLFVKFSNGNKSYLVPGFYAADGNAAESGAESGKAWKVRFTPDETGEWTYSIIFKKGKNIAISDNYMQGEGVSLDGKKGTFMVNASDKRKPDFRSLGRIEVAGRYLKHAGSDDYFLKGGADSPENFLAYVDFDQTYRYGEKAIFREGEANPKESCHQYKTHLTDWKEGNPTWKSGKGKSMIGALNYLASQGVNSVYMLLMNIQGDGKDVWPYTDYNERYRFDCSKLDQWEIVFDYMDQLGMMMHFVLQETENECLLDGGHTQAQRKLYLREMIARFGHHLGITWNLGEENGPAHWTPVGQTDQMRKDMASYLKKIDPYSSFVVLHTHADAEGQNRMLNPLLGFEDLDGISMQIGNVMDINERISNFVETSGNSGHRWVVCLDEIGPASKGVMPDEFDQGHDTVRQHALWGALMGGAAGVEWYFGYRYPNNDLMCEDFSSRENWWKQTKIALDFFRNYLPFDKMEAMNGLITSKQAFCFALKNEVYAAYFSDGSGTNQIDLSRAQGNYAVDWYNPRTGGVLQKGSVKQLAGGSSVNLGLPPDSVASDWVVLISRK